MARPTTTGLSRTPGFAPQQQGSTQRAGVYAPLDARVGKSSAEHFADALGLANETVQPVIKQKVAEKARDQTVEGMRDAAAGKVDQKRVAEDEYYARGQKKTLADRAVLDASNEFERKLQTGEVKRGSVDELRGEFSAFMQEKLGAFLADPEAAQWAYEKLAPLEVRLMGELQKEQVAKFREDSILTVGDSIRHAIKNNVPVDFESEKAKLIAANMTRGEATKVLVDSIGSIAVEARDPNVLNLIPETWADGTPGPRSIPELNNEINQYRYYAESQKRAEESEIKRQAEQQAVGQVNEATVMAANGNLAGAKKVLDGLLLRGLIERSEYQSVVNFGRGTVDYYREESFTADRVAEWRSNLAEGKFATEREANNAARGFLPGGSVGGRAMQQMADDSSTFFRARENDTKPLVKSHKDTLTAYLTPTVETSQSRNRRADLLLKYDKLIVAGKEPEAAFEEVKKLVDNTNPGPAANSTAPRKVGPATVTLLSQ